MTFCCAFTDAAERTSPRAFLEGEAKGQLDLPMARQGGFVGGLFAIFVPSTDGANGPNDETASQASAVAPCRRQPSNWRRRKGLYSAWCLFFCVSSASRRAAFASAAMSLIFNNALKDGVLAPVLHIEGAEAIDPNFEFLDVLYEAGLRSLGPVWSRPNAFGHGVPFRCPSSPDTGPGLTDLGKELIGACNRLRILIDLSHLNERGFWDVAAISNAPLVATHSNAHALSPHSRNLTDSQLAAIRETGGIVGVNFATSFLRRDGRHDADTPIELVIEHLEHILEHVGEDGVGFGSDFDGAKIPAANRKCCRTAKSCGGHAYAWLRRAADREVVLQKLVTSVGTNLGKGPYPVSGCEIWQQDFLRLPDNCFDGYPLRRRWPRVNEPRSLQPREAP